MPTPSTHRHILALLFAGRAARMLANGALAVCLGLYLASRGLSTRQVGILITCAMLGDATISLGFTLVADRVGRRRVLAAGAVLMVLASAGFLFLHSFVALCALAFVAVFSANGREVGPFLPVEQAGIAERTEAESRTHILAYYNFVGFLSGGLGALLVGGAAWYAREYRGNEALGYSWIVIGYGLVGLVLIVFALMLPAGMEARSPTVAPRFGLHKSRGIVMRLSCLFALDSFAGGLVLQSLLALWLSLRFGLRPESIGGYFFVAELLAGFSGLVAARLASRFGLIHTMVFTHLPANCLLILVAFAPTAGLALALLVLRASVSSMDIPTRQAYTLAVVDPDERSAAGGVTNIARSIGNSFSPAIAGTLIGIPALISSPLILAGGLKIAYDLLLLKAFRNTKPAHEQAKEARTSTRW
jgi:MFS family permease